MAAVPFRAKIWIALASVYVIWGSTYLAIRIAVETLPPLAMAGLRFLIAGALMYVVGIARGDRAGDRPTAAHWRNAWIIGTALCLGGNGFVTIAENRPEMTSGMAALIVATVPLWVAGFERVLFGARFARAASLGLLGGFAGVALLMLPSDGGADVDRVGAMLVLIAAALWAGGSLFARRADLPQRPVVSTGMEMLGGGASMTVVALIGGEFGRLDLGGVSRASFIAFCYLVIFGSVAGFTAYVWLLRNVRTSLATTYAYVNPLVAVVLGALVLSEQLSVLTAVAGAVIVASVALIVRATGGDPRADDAVPPDERIDLSVEETIT